MTRTQHRRVNAINERYQRRDDQKDEQEVTEQEIVRPQRHLHNLDNELASGLRHRRRAKATAVPLTSPPRAVRLLVLELTREENRNQDLLDRSLNSDDGDDTEHCMRGIPKLEEPLQTA